MRSGLSACVSRYKADSGTHNIAAIILLISTSPAVAKAEELRSNSDLSVSLGASAWSGDFGAPTDTFITSVLLGARYRVGNLRLSATLPRMRIRSDGTLFAGINGAPMFVSPTTAPQSRVRDGLGDLTLGASYLVESVPLGVDLELLGRVKLPTASASSQLSTGKTDVAMGASLSKTIGRLTPSVTATYRWFGDTNIWKFRNGFEISAGASYAVTDTTIAFLSYDYARATTALIGDYHELVGAVSTPVLTNRLRLTAFAGKGLSSGAADVSGGVSVSLRL
jgi:hypothetical protein